ncbi:hypothetical protein JL475_28500 [Streptomyces sp. M2CJ-2]|uniref:hypothetical protein n=1 Tax=Streptomyces sp. M2CJ-2 TaxID=2803948 RepID=UPI0019277E34|nr:hypothetical protein [Streptomyces sp. M2CJ-2]MBL3669855.1 hypothetical protein [Streptomyces sp. M2CJ-2]
MHAKRTVALVASPLAAAVALAFSPAAMAQGSADTTHAASVSVNQVLKPPTPGAKEGARDGRVAGQADGPDCEYKQSWAPKSKNSKYMQAYSAAYEKFYDRLCTEEE